MVGDDETNFSHKLLLTKTRVLRTHKTFANDSSANIKCSNTQLAKILQLGGFLGTLLDPY